VLLVGGVGGFAVGRATAGDDRDGPDQRGNFQRDGGGFPGDHDFDGDGPGFSDEDDGDDDRDGSDT
jgi:hypothetical protein